MVNLFGKRIRLFRPHSIWVRKIVQWFFLLLIAAIAINHTLAESGAAIPFENLSINYKQPIILKEDLLNKKIVEDKRGGFCYDMN